MSKARPMQLTERRSEGLLRVYDVVVPAAELQQKLNAKIAEVQPRVRINGFRPGKVPVSHIRKVYGPSMMQDIINETVQKSTRESLEKASRARLRAVARSEERHAKGRRRQARPDSSNSRSK